MASNFVIYELGAVHWVVAQRMCFFTLDLYFFRINCLESFVIIQVSELGIVNKLRYKLSIWILSYACARHRCQHWSSSPNIAISTRQQYRFNFDCGHTDLWTIRDNSHPVIFSSFNIRAYKLCVTFFFMLGLGHWEGGIAIGLNPWSLSD